MMSQQKHKHLVALPLFAACMLVVTGSNALVGSVLAHGNETLIPVIADQKPVTWQPSKSLAVTLDAKSGLSQTDKGTRLRFLYGSAVINTDSLVQVRFDTTWNAVWMNGAVAVLEDAHGVTLVALTTSILAKDPSGAEWMIPHGYQLDIKKETHSDPVISATPAAWLDDKQSVIPSIRSAESTDEQTALQTMISSDAYDKALALVTTEPADTTGFPDALQSVFAQPDVGMAHTQLALELTRKAAPDFPSIDFLTLLTLAAHRGLSDTDPALAHASFADAFADQIARMIGAEAAHLSRPLPAAFVTLWQSNARNYAAHEPAAALRTLLPDALQTREQLSDQFPVSAGLWNSSIQDIVHFAEPLLSEQNHTDVQSLLMQAEGKDSAAASSADSVPKPEPAVIADESCIAQAKADLLASGSMLTSETSFQCLSDGSADIRSLYIATKAGDALFDLRYNSSDHLVSHIVENGKSLPNSLRLDSFVKSL